MTNKQKQDITSLYKFIFLLIMVKLKEKLRSFILGGNARKKQSEPTAPVETKAKNPSETADEPSKEDEEALRRRRAIEKLHATELRRANEEARKRNSN